MPADDSIPPETAAYLVVPVAVDLAVALKPAFPQCAWVRTPAQAEELSRPRAASGGARFRGMVTAVEPVGAVLELVPGVELTQVLAVPFPGVGAEHVVYAMPHDTAVAARLGATAAGLHAVIVGADGAPVPVAAREADDVAMHLYSAQLAGEDQFFALVRAAISKIEPAVAQPPARALLVWVSDVDGTVEFTAHRAGSELPHGLASLDWREYGPHVYSVRWLPPADADPQVRTPGSTYAISRGRVLPLLARTMRHLAGQLTGVVVDDAGAVIDEAGLTARILGR